MLTYLIYQSVQNFFTDFRKKEPVSNFRLNMQVLNIEGAQLANFTLVTGS